MTLGDVIVQRVSHTDYLGLRIDDTLSWQQHVDKILRSLVKYFGIFYQLRKSIPHSFKKHIYNAYILSRMQYGIEIYGSMAEYHRNKLQIMSNKLLKLLYNRDRLTDTNTLHKDLQILKLKDVRIMCLSKFVHQCLYSSKIPIFQQYYVFRNRMHNKTLINRSVLNVPKYKTSLGNTATKCHGAQVWNNLPLLIRVDDNVDSFKVVLRDHLLSSY